MINKFWSEFNEFQSKAGVFEHRGYIFKNHEDLINSRAYMWHKKETFSDDSLVGFVLKFLVSVPQNDHGVTLNF